MTALLKWLLNKSNIRLFTQPVHGCEGKNMAATGPVATCLKLAQRSLFSRHKSARQHYGVIAV
jgi:hypothetical protein